MVRCTRRRAARGGGAGRVGPPATGRRLRVLRQIREELVPGVEQFLLVDDVVAVEDGAALVAGQESTMGSAARGRFFKKCLKIKRLE